MRRLQTHVLCQIHDACQGAVLKDWWPPVFREMCVESMEKHASHFPWGVRACLWSSDISEVLRHLETLFGGPNLRPSGWMMPQSKYVKSGAVGEGLREEKERERQRDI